MHVVIARISASIHSGLPVPLAGRRRLPPVAVVRYTAAMAATRREHEPQFPAPTATAPDPVVEVERLPAPGKAARLLMAKHLREEHGIGRFHLDRHVHLGGPRAASQLITWLPATASFHCDLCPGYGFWTGEITDEIVSSTQLFDPGVQPHLAGLTDPTDRTQMTRLYLDGTLNRRRLTEANKAAHREASARSRPGVAERRRRLQELMLELYEQLGIVARVLDAVEELQKRDQVQWEELAGRPLSRRTLHGYWLAIDPTRVARAKQRFEQRKR
jgi:hypothetical protein